MTESNKMVCVGVISASHGIRGQVKIKSFTEEPWDIASYGSLYSKDGKRHFELTLTSDTKQALIASIAGITDRTQADALKGTELYISRDSLPQPEDEDEFYYEDLIGCRVIGVDGTAYGHIRQIMNHGAGDLIEILTPHQTTELFAFTRDNFPEIDLAQRCVTFIPPEEIEAETEDSPHGAKP